MDQPNQETERESLVHLLTSLCLSNGNIRLNHENLNSAPVFGAYQNYEPELIGISSVHGRYSPGIPVSAIISPSRPPTSSGIFNIPNSGNMCIIPGSFNSAPGFAAFQNYEPELIGISSVHGRYPPGIPVSAIISPSRPSISSVFFNIPDSDTQEEVCHAVAQKQSPLDKRAQAAVDAYLYGIAFMKETYKKARNEHNNYEVQIKLDELDRIEKYLNNLKGADPRGLNEVRTRLLDLLQHAERISKAEKEGSASAQMNTPLHQASQAEGVDWSHIPQITQRASESAHQEETRRVDAFMQLPMVRNVLSTGVDRNLVRYAIEGMLRETGTMFRDGEALMNAVLNFAQSREVVNTPSFVREPHRNASPSYSQNTESRRSRSQNPDLETENSRLRQCNVCLEADACIHFRPCGHLCCCEACANRVTTCPLCRANIHEKLKTYFC